MTVVLRPYQEQAVRNVIKMLAGLETGRQRVLMVLPTGAGKTVTAARMVHGAIDAEKPVLWVAHRRELISQARDTFVRYGIPPDQIGIILAGEVPTPDAMVQVASVQTLSRRELPPGVLYVFIDEAHRAAAASYAKILDAYPEARVIGLTATPVRETGRGLKDVFHGIVVGADVPQLIRDGMLVDPRIFAPPVPDTAAIATKHGDFDERELAAVFDKPHLVGDVVEHWQRLAEGTRTIVFAINREHSRNIATAFTAAGIPAAHLDGETDDDQRAETLEALREGRLQVVVNVGILGEGFDLPAIGCVVLARPTKSLALYLQQIGRVMRPAEGKTGALVLDHAGNVFRHGLPSEPRGWTLDGPARKGAGAGIKNCPECYRVVVSGMRTCPCGYEWLIEHRDRQLETDGATELVEVKGRKDYFPLWPAELADIKPRHPDPTRAQRQSLVDYLEPLAWKRPAGRRGAYLRARYQQIMGRRPGAVKLPSFPGEEYSFRTAMLNRKKRQERE